MKYYYSSGVKSQWIVRYYHLWRRRLKLPANRWLNFGLVVLVAVVVVLAVVAIAGHSPPPRRMPAHAVTKDANARRPVAAPVPPVRPYGFAVGDTLVGLSSAQLNAELKGIASSGVGWIRIDVSWADVQPQSAAQYNWTALDGVVAAATQYHLKILATVAYTPPWARPAGCESQSCAPASDSRFAAFMAAATARYSPKGVHDWEVWNEPNLEGFWQPTPNPTAYTHLLQASYAAIKKNDRTATVISGGLGALDSSPVSISEVSFLAGMYEAGAKAAFDAVGYHPYSYPALPSQVQTWNSWSMMNDLPQSIRSVMIANGDASKQVWITEFGAPTNGPGALATVSDPNFGAHPDHVSAALQSAMVTEAIDQYKKLPWLGGFFWYTYQDLGTSPVTNENFFGLLNANGTAKPAYAAFRNAITSATK